MTGSASICRSRPCAWNSVSRVESAADGPRRSGPRGCRYAYRPRGWSDPARGRDQSFRRRTLLLGGRQTDASEGAPGAAARVRGRRFPGRSSTSIPAQLGPPPADGRCGDPDKHADHGSPPRGSWCRSASAARAPRRPRRHRFDSHRDSYAEAACHRRRLRVGRLSGTSHFRHRRGPPAARRAAGCRLRGSDERRGALRTRRRR
jgi:hypothetical protein